MAKLRYRLALDLGSTSLGWAMVRLNASDEPCAIIRAGVRIFSDGRNPKDGASLAVSRREARAMRRRRDRLLRRKARMMALLTEHGFFPSDEAGRKALERLDPYALRAKGLDSPLSGPEFARALFHINQRRGFKSNRKTDKKESDSGALKSAISALRAQLAEGGSRTVGEWLHKRHIGGGTVRARYRQQRVQLDGGKTRIDKSYDLYVDRAMIEDEFDKLWAAQAALNPQQFHENARLALKDCLLFQRQLRPVVPGRCTLLPEEPRAPLALPSTQRFRIYQEVNNLRVLREGLKEEPLTMQQRDIVVAALERNGRCTFTKLRKLLGLGGATRFNLEDVKREELKGNATSAVLSRDNYLGDAWYALSEQMQDEVVSRLVTEQSEDALIRWLIQELDLDEARAAAVANAALPEGYGSLSASALARILPELRRAVVTFDKAVIAAGFEHHSHISHAATGEILPSLPYYGEYLQRHVGFGTGKPEDVPEKRYGRIANPTVHIGLNQVRVVVNALIKRYGHPSEIIVELARDLKQSQDERKRDSEQQAVNQKRNARLRQDAAQVLGVAEERVKHADIQKLLLWEELSRDVADRHCPYSGVQLSARMVLSDEVEIEHILPFSMTLDDSLNNKTVALRKANRVKGNRTPWQAREDFEAQGWAYAAIVSRAAAMPQKKQYRFAEDGFERWLKDDKDFLARALNDTRHLSRVAKEYLSLICPQNTRAIPGRMTAQLRGKFGLNDVLGLSGEKNRNDHRHHAVDACVIGVTDQGMLQRFAQASASARERQLDKLVENMPLPWATYREHVQRAIENIWVSHKPDHGYEGALHNDTAYGLDGGGVVHVHKIVDGVRVREQAPLKVIEIASRHQAARHGQLADGSPKPYKGYKGDSNFCTEIVRTDAGRWEAEVISTFQAYQAAKRYGKAALCAPRTGIAGKPLVMRLMIGDTLRLIVDGRVRTMRVATLSANGQVFMADVHEANVDARNRDKSDAFAYVSKYAGSLRAAQGRRVTISPIGDLVDHGFQA